MNTKTMTREQFGKLIADIYAMRSMDRDGGEIELTAELAESQTPSPDDSQGMETLHGKAPHVGTYQSGVRPRNQCQAESGA